MKGAKEKDKNKGKKTRTIEKKMMRKDIKCIGHE
jgi:hypothetical protein